MADVFEPWRVADAVAAYINAHPAARPSVAFVAGIAWALEELEAKIGRIGMRKLTEGEEL